MKLVAVAVALAAALLPPPASAQGWVAGIGLGGTDHRTVARDVGTTSAMLEVRREGARWLYLSAGLPVDTAGLPWGAVGIGGRLETGRSPLSFGVDLAAHGYGYRERQLGANGGGATLEALPFVAARRGAARLELHSGVRSYGSTFAGNTFSRSVLDTGARLGFAPDPRVSLTADARWLRAAEGNFPYAGAEAGYTEGPVSGWAYLGRWLVDAIPTATWGVGGSVEVAAGMRVEVSLQQDTNDPLYWNAPRRFWSLGVTRGLAAARTAAPVVPPAPILPETSDGRVMLRMPAAEAAEAPSVAGDFNQWKPVPMRRVGDQWELALAIEPGVYHYSFRRADGSWFVPASITNRVDDGFGGANAVLVVPPPAGSR